MTCFTANDLCALHGQTGDWQHTRHEYAEFAWYEPVCYYEFMPFPQTKRQIALWLGVAHHVSQALCFVIGFYPI